LNFRGLPGWLILESPLDNASVKRKGPRRRRPPKGAPKPRPRYTRYTVFALPVVLLAVAATVFVARRGPAPGPESAQRTETKEIQRPESAQRPETKEIQRPKTVPTLAVPTGSRGQLQITYPQDGTLFPPEIVAPTFLWNDKSDRVDHWFVMVRSEASDAVLRFSAPGRRWRPSEEDWTRIKEQAREADAEVAIVGVNHAGPTEVLSSASVRIRTSTDPVGDPIFYREVPLPFIHAVQDPSRIRWRFGAIDSQTAPPIVLENLPVCGNCHSFSADGGVLGLDVDYGNDKGGYAILPVKKEMVLNETNIITWADYKKEDGELTFGLLSQVSPDGRYAVSTVKDRAVFVATPELAFSQLFFPIKGILVIYDQETKTFQALPGADDPEYVQSNPTWSPDGQYIVFARAKAYRATSIADKTSILLDEKDVPEFITDKKPFRFDLYRIPFNDGRGGTPEPLEGASHNGMSNFFAKYSPDGKWIVFTKASNYMLLQPDSELFIIPAEGGVPRRLRSNTARMNSWHSWSSNSRWLVFSSKVNTVYTQLFLTHIDADGRDTPPVLLERFTSSDRAANIPEFVHTSPDRIAQIREEFLDAYSFLRAGMANERTGNYPGAVRAYRRGLKNEPENPELLNSLGWALFQQGKSAEAVVAYRKALAADPDHFKAHNNMALASVELGELDEAELHFRKSLELEPKAEIYSDLGFVLERQGQIEEAHESYRKALDLDPKCAPAHVNLAVALVRQGAFEEAERHYRVALETKPNAETYNGLGFVLSKQGKLDEAVAQFREAIRTNRGFAPAYYNLGASLETQGKLEEAADAYRDLVRDHPSARAHNKLGAVLVELGRTDEAVRELQAAIAMDPGYADARRNLAAVHARQP
jgi:tetratricopeptide (TPR) repeat protein